MKPEEALKFFKDFIETLKLNSRDKVLNNDYCKASTQAIEALEKQIPITAVADCTEDGSREVFCRVCGQVFDTAYKHCHNCGQKIDWKE